MAHWQWRINFYYGHPLAAKTGVVPANLPTRSLHATTKIAALLDSSGWKEPLVRGVCSDRLRVHPFNSNFNRQGTGHSHLALRYSWQILG
ncbi:UNVERIFIED_CONTAM: hypothetical protein Sangu_2006300 [Sesamum angustifolium]|uniref:Uncharacterized protein n=1 Tax=Sesamum angustifolium TaxID=2727405 RepID=A0AAW2LJW1_9LAMI